MEDTVYDLMEQVQDLPGGAVKLQLFQYTENPGGGSCGGYAQTLCRIRV